MTRAEDLTPAYNDQQRREAADWFVIIRSAREELVPEPGGAESIQMWLKWMDQDEGNRAAFDAVARAWHGIALSSLPALASERELAADEYEAEQSVQTWLNTAGLGCLSSHGEPTPRGGRPWFSRSRWLAAAAVVVAFASFLGIGRLLSPRAMHSEVFTTRTGEQVEITLSDGSHVWLGPRSKLLVAFAQTRRGIQLSAGEAFFSVKKDPQRPFVVGSDGGEIVAVGTAFNVRAIDERVTVAVSEGTVSVTPTAQLAVRTPATVRVNSGQQLTFTAREPVTSMAIVQSADTGERARWRDGVLVYRDEPLREVINDVLRYSDLQVRIADPAVGNLHYSGVIYHDALQEWLLALPESFPVTIKKDGNREIISAR